MSKIAKIKSYLFTPQKCFIPKCRAHCCINAPLPEGFLEQNRAAVQRPIFSTLKMGKNAFWDNYNSEIHNTSPVRQVIGFDKNGQTVHGIPRSTLDDFGVKTKEDLDLFLKQNDGILNYCPFITDYCRCSVYDHRPPICHEFGSFPGKINYCPDKASRMEIVKFFFKEFSFKRFFKNAAAELKTKFSPAG